MSVCPPVVRTPCLLQPTLPDTLDGESIRSARVARANLLSVAAGLLAINVTLHYSLLAMGYIRHVALLNLIAGGAMLALMALLLPVLESGAALGRIVYGPVTWLLYLKLNSVLRNPHMLSQSASTSVVTAKFDGPSYAPWLRIRTMQKGLDREFGVRAWLRGEPRPPRGGFDLAGEKIIDWGWICANLTLAEKSSGNRLWRVADSSRNARAWIQGNLRRSGRDDPSGIERI